MANQKEAWGQLPGESDLWYARFDVFRSLGSVRTVRMAYQLAREDDETLKSDSPSQAWFAKSKEYRWAERARAWDEQIRDSFRSQELELVRDRQLARLQKIKVLEEESFKALVTANLGGMNQSEARAYLPQLRMLITALLGLERVELGGSANQDEEPASDLPDEILKSLEKWNQQNGSVKADVGSTIRAN